MSTLIYCLCLLILIWRGNRRVCEVVLNGDKTFSLTQKKFKVSDALKTGEASALFGVLELSYRTWRDLLIVL